MTRSPGIRSGRVRRLEGRSMTMLLVALTTLALCCCDDPAGPSEQPNPGGDVVIWFNGLSYTVDLYFPGSDSLVTTAYITGEIPNDLIALEENLFGVVCSGSGSFQVFDLLTSGATVAEADLGAGTNPYSAAVDPATGEIYVTLLLSSAVTVLDGDDYAPRDTICVAPNPSGVVVSGGYLFVSHGNYPDPSFTGGVTVYDLPSGECLDTLATPENTVWLRHFGETTDMIHAGATTYVGDGTVSVLDPALLQVIATVPTGGTPGPPARVGSTFYSGDAWSSTSVFLYGESGSVIDQWDCGHNVTGICCTGDEGLFFMTDFGADMVYVADPGSGQVTDSLAAGDGPQGILFIDR